MIPVSARLPDNKAKIVFDLIRKHHKASKTELIEWTRLTSSTLTRTLDDLVTLGAIIEVGLGESTGGRKPILYEVNPKFAFVFGLEISRSVTNLVLFDVRMKVIDAAAWPMTGEMDPEHLFHTVKAAMDRMLHQHRLPSHLILGMGIGSVGPLDRKRGLILDPLYFPAPGWSNIEICSWFEERVDFPVLLDHGVNASLVGECWLRNGRKKEHVVYLHAGVGIRSAYMTGGKMVYGAIEHEGSIGQMIIQTDGAAPREKNQNYGSLESYASLYAIEQQARSFLKQGRISRISHLADRIDQVQFSHILQALRENDALAQELITQGGTYMGIGIANVLSILHPEEVILGGPLVVHDDLFFNTAKQVALEKIRFYPSYEPIFSKGQLGEQSIAFGSALLMISQLAEPVI